MEAKARCKLPSIKQQNTFQKLKRGSRCILLRLLPKNIIGLTRNGRIGVKISLDMAKGEWVLTKGGYRRLYYLCKKFRLQTRREKREWQAWVEQEIGKPFEQRRIWRVEGVGIRMVKEGESGTTLNEAKSVVEFNRSMAR